MSELGIEKERSLDSTSTWAVAVVCLVIVAISLLLEHALHAIAKWFKKLHKPALVEALEKVETELMLMGFISLLLTVGQGPISGICISQKLASKWLPCDINAKETAKVFSSKITRRRLLHLLSSDEIFRRSLAVAPKDKCSEKGKVAFVSGYGIHQLHYLIFVLAVFHIFYCIITYMLSTSKMRIWKYWENETRRMENQESNERSQVAKDTSFGRRHLTAWNQPTIILWIICFFRQFYGSVTSVDYRTLRHGFIMAHFAPGAESRFDFHDYINRSLEEDFKHVVGIPFSMWLIALFFLLAKTNGLYSYYWLPFLPLLVALVVGTKLQLIITRLGLRIHEKGEIVKGRLVVQPADDLFWFGKPRFVLFLIHLILFQNAFQLAFFIWGWWKFGIGSCLHAHKGNIAIRIAMGLLIQFLCSYVTLPLYSLVSQMGSNVRPTIFNDRVATALKKWHEATKKKRAKESKHSESVSHNNATSTASTPRDSCHHHHRCRDCNRQIDDSEPNSPKKRGNEADASVHSDRHGNEGGNVSKNARSGKVMPVQEISTDAP